MEQIDRNRKFTIIYQFLEDSLYDYINLNYDNDEIDEYDFRCTIKCLKDLITFVSDQLTEVN